MNVAFDIHGPECASIVLTQVLQQLIRNTVVVECQGRQVAECGHDLMKLGAAVHRQVMTEEILDVEL
jgi:hypothetical protein